MDPESDPYHSYLTKCWTAILGVYLFFIVDKLLKIVIEYKKVCYLGEVLSVIYQIERYINFRI